MEIFDISKHFHQIINSKGSIPLSLRKERLRHLKEEVLKRESAINEALRLDLGKSVFESYATEVGFILLEIEHLLKRIDKLVSPRKVRTPLSLFPGRSFIYPEPYGLVLIMAPWNYPFQLSLAPLIGALAAGNRIVLKPSEMAPHTSRILAEIMGEVFLPDEVYVVEGGVEETQSLLSQKFDYIFFTGSTAVGRIVMEAAAKNLTPVTLELGGKSPCLISEKTNLELVAKRCTWGKFMNAGQTCVAPDFVLIPRQEQDEFIERMTSQIKAFYGASPSESPDFARIINERHFDRLINLLEGSNIAFGGDHDRAAKYIGPTLLKDVSWDAPVMKEEIFGPILPVIPYDSLDEAMLRIKSLSKPLAFYVFTEDAGLAETVLQKCSFGGGCVNDTLVHLANPNLPFGGVGESGLGSYHGLKSFETFSHYKSVFKQRNVIDIPVRYPPYKGKLGWLKFFLR